MKLVVTFRDGGQPENLTGITDTEINDGVLRAWVCSDDDDEAVIAEHFFPLEVIRSWHVIEEQQPQQETAA